MGVAKMMAKAVAVEGAELEVKVATKAVCSLLALRFHSHVLLVL